VSNVSKVNTTIRMEKKEGEGHSKVRLFRCRESK